MIEAAITSRVGSSAQLPIMSVNIAPIPASASRRVYMTALMPTKNSCAVATIDSLRLAMNFGRSSLPCTTPMTAARKAPPAPASVGVTTPP